MASDKKVTKTEEQELAEKFNAIRQKQKEKAMSEINAILKKYKLRLSVTQQIVIDDVRQ